MNNEDYKLFEKVKQKDSEAIITLINKNKNLVYYTINNYFSNYANEKRRELESVGLMALFKSIIKFDYTIDYAFSTYAIATIKGEIFNYLKFMRRMDKEIPLSSLMNEEEENPEQLLDKLLHQTDDLFFDCEKKETINEVEYLLNMLPTKYRLVFTIRIGFYDNKEKSLEETSILTGIPQRSIRYYYKKTLLFIRECFIDEHLKSDEEIEELLYTNFYKSGETKMTFFDYFPNIDKEIIESVFESLPIQQKEKVYSLYGISLIEYNSKNEDLNYVTNVIVPKIKRRIITGTSRRNADDIKYDIDSHLQIIYDSEIYKRLLTVLTNEEALLLCLRLGLVNDKSFNRTEVSSYFHIKKTEVGKRLLAISNKLNNTIDIGTKNVKKLNKILEKTKQL